MEPITMAIITPFLIELGKKGIEKFTEKGFESISEGTIGWIKSLFFKDGKPKKALFELQENPESIEKQNIAKAFIENSIEDNPEFATYLKELNEKLPNIENTISNNKNVNTGTINSGGGNIQLGDNYGN
ncbi:hypothetical protein MW871_10885 [Flavobacterium sp. I-SCBP12n]|uniref:Uncharacterized protein n=1 Tax=Flavobacterium pygoscelis TaxID=2893176 RepID=A0A9X1XVM1_9FLAO|nr:hypothetical protein [Flavobacterium pygoscelis]MCK8142396.1 hypothetical protein [Flavobacterium pygoscelis]